MTTPQAALLSDDETDRHLDSVLVASGSALRHFSLPYNVENMRKAMHAHEAAILAKLQATQEPVQAGELPDEHIPSIGCGFWIDKISVSNLRHIHRSESATAMISALINATDAIEDAQALIATLRSALSARKPLTDEQIEPMFKARNSIQAEGTKDAWYWYAWGVNDGEQAHGIGGNHADQA